MALYQPTNVTPDLISGPENGLVLLEPLGSGEVSWTINGNSPLVAYRIEFFKNNAASTPGADTGKVTLAEPFYGKDAYGNERRITVTLPYNPYFEIAALSPNYEGKLRITQWWGDTDAQSIVQRSLSVFRTFPSADAYISSPAAQADGSYTFTAIPLLPPIENFGESSILWVRWEIVNADSGDTVEDTGKVWGASDYSYQTGMLLPGTYFAQLSFEMSYGQTVVKYSDTFTVGSEVLDSPNALTAVCDQSAGAVLLTARMNKSYPGEYSGVGIGEDYIQVNDTDGYAMVEFPAVSSEPWGFLWEGSVWESGSEQAGQTAFRLTLENGTSVRFGFSGAIGEPIPVLNPTQGAERIGLQEFEYGAQVRIAFVHTGTDEYAWCFAAYQIDGPHYSYTDWLYELFSTSAPVKLELFYNSRTTGFTLLFGQDGIDAIQDAITSSAEFTVPAVPALVLNPTSFTMQEPFFGGANSATIWRGKVGDSALTKIAEISDEESASWLDYGPGTGGKYYYVMAGAGSNGDAITTRTEEIAPCFWDWLLIEADAHGSAAVGDYPVLNVFKFGMNFSSGSDGNGAAPNVVSTFTPYPLVMRDTQNRHSGTLAGLIGQMTEPGKYEVTNETRDALRALSRTDHPIFVRTRRGDFFRVAISGEIVTTVQDNALKQPISVSVPWVEIGPVDGSVLEPVPIIPELTPQEVVDASAEMTAEQKAQMKANLWYATESWVTEKINELITVDDTTP